MGADKGLETHDDTQFSDDLNPDLFVYCSDHGAELGLNSARV